MWRYLILVLTFSLFPAIVISQVISDDLVQSNHQGIVKNLRTGINTNGFEPNLGQVGDYAGEKVKDVLFLKRHRGIDLYVRSGGVSYIIRSYELKDGVEKIRNESNEVKMKRNGEEIDRGKEEWSRVDINLLGTRLDDKIIEYKEPMSGYTNYYLSHCPEGVLFVPSYKVVRIKGVYPGIDWVWRIGDDGVLHHEFEIENGGDVDKIKLEVKWADVKLLEDGKKLKLSTPVGEIEDGEIFSYDESGKVNISYVIEEGKFISFDVKGSTKGKLIIDPPLSRLWATYYGGNNYDIGHSIKTDANGNVIIIGHTQSVNFPTYNSGGDAYFQGNYAGGSDVFIVKFNNNGIRLWSTYYGGDSIDYGYSLTTDPNGNVFVTGETYSTNFPTYNSIGAYYQGTLAGFSNAFILKFSSAGIRNWATYYGGNFNSYGYSITSDANGNIFVTGSTWSSDFPTYDPGGGAYVQGNWAGGYDAFILKFSNLGALMWATYYGGSGDDAYSPSITTDANGNIFVTGNAGSYDFPTYDPGFGAYFQGNLASAQHDAFILKFSNSGVRQWATYYGGSNVDFGYSITTDPQGNVFLIGITSSDDFPTYSSSGNAYYDGTYNGNNDVFILKFSNFGIRQCATYYGGSDADGYQDLSISTDANGNIFITGETSSVDFPNYNPGGNAYFQESWAGGISEAFILKFSNYGVRLWSTFYGGSYDDYGISVTTDANGNVFITGKTYSNDFPTYDPGGGAYYQGIKGEINYWTDAFILKFEGEGTIGVEDKTNNFPDVYFLSQNYPNPFNPVTKINYTVKEETLVKIKLLDILGREIATLLNEIKSPDEYTLELDASKLGLSSGIYLYQMNAGKFYAIRKLIFLK